MELNGYDLSRDWWDWAFENPEKVTPNHAALYFFIIEHCNRLGWKEKFGLPTEMTKNAIGISNYRTYSKAFEDLIEWGFIRVIERSKNQYSANVVALVKNTIATTKALSKATQKHLQKQVHGTVGIIKPLTINKEPINHKQEGGEPEGEEIESPTFEDFWDAYDKKVGSLEKVKKKWGRLSQPEKEKIMDYIPAYKNSQPDKVYRKHPETFLNNQSWNDEIITKKTNQNADNPAKQLTRAEIFAASAASRQLSTFGTAGHNGP